MRSRGWLVGSTLLLVGCGGEAADAGADTELATVVRTDSGGTEIVRTNVPAWDDGGAWAVDPEPELVIGQVEGEEPYLFGEIRGAVRLDDGSVVVVDEWGLP